MNLTEIHVANARMSYLLAPFLGQSKTKFRIRFLFQLFPYWSDDQ
nr:MAG TPA: hypothetical protein [Caudoviricetes sp.]